MGWAYLDDQFPEHRKVLAAGGDAGWLYVCGLCFANRTTTGGRIPKAMVGRLSDRKNPERLARRLVEVGLWEDVGDDYVIHDWPDWNEPAETVKARKEQARKAAQARWRKDGRSSAGAHAQSMPGALLAASDEHMPNAPPSNAPADAPPLRARGTPSPKPPDVSQTPLNHQGVAPAGLEALNGLRVGQRLDDGPATGGVGYATGSNPNPKPTELADRLAGVCTADNRRLVATEARAVVDHALAHVDWRVVDEAIGAYAAGDKRPTLPRALVPAIQRRADSAGIALPDWSPAKGRRR